MSYAPRTETLYVKEGSLTIAEALAEAAAMRQDGALHPITIKLCDALYVLDAPIDVTVSDVTIEPMAGTCTISGGTEITGFEADVFCEVPCVSADVRGIAPFTDLYVGGKRAHVPRYPKTGTIRARDVENREGKLFSSSTYIIADPADLAPVTDLADATVSFCHYWVDEHTPVAAYDEGSGRIDFLYPSRFSVTDEYSTEGAVDFYIENTRAGFGTAGDFYLDRTAERLYYIPEEDTTPGEIRAYAPRLHQLFRIEGTDGAPVRGVRLRALTMVHTRGDYASFDARHDRLCASDSQSVAEAGAAVLFRYARDCAVEACELSCFGLHGIEITDGCENVTVSRSHLHDGGAGGIKISGSAPGGAESARTRRIRIEHNTLRTLGRRYLSACGILLKHASDCILRYNEISDLFYTGISVGWVWGYGESVTYGNDISYNHIFDLGKGVLSDMGGIYLLSRQPGTVVSHNHIHDVKSKTYGGWALYADEGCSYVLFEHNLCHDVSENCFHQHYGSHNTVRNNIFAFSRCEPLKVSLYEEHTSTVFARNVVLTDGRPVYCLRAEHLANGTVFSDCNLFVTGDIPLCMTETHSQKDFAALGLDTASRVIPDPFRDAAARDFTFAALSDALADCGFHPFQTEPTELL